MPAPKNYIKIAYPRKCVQCDYTANNPQMWHYHKKTHTEIPKGTVCGHGCSQSANYINTNNVYTCTKISHQCPEYVRKHSERIKEHWARPNSILRKEETTKSLRERLHNPKTAAKQSSTKRTKSGTFTADLAKDFRHYARFIRQRAQVWAVSQGHVLGKQTYHVDHRFSILDAWKNNLPEHIVNHPANLQILEAKINSSKGSKSELTLENLYAIIKEYDERTK